jgi:O-antigen/teichoic acid export membrane protein
MSAVRPASAAPPTWLSWSPPLAAASRELRVRMSGQRTFVTFILSAGAVNVVSLVTTGFAFRGIDPESMGIWHTLLLLSSYLTIVRLGLVNGMGRELPFALGQGEEGRARRIASTALAYNAVCCGVVAAAFIALLVPLWPNGPSWRIALVAMAVTGASNLHLAYLQATYRSSAEFDRLSRIQWAQAAAGILLPVMAYAWGFAGLCVHAALQALTVTALAHRRRPFPVAARFDPVLARQLLATGLPLFLAGYLQVLATGFDRVVLLHRGGVAAVGYYAPAVAVLAAMAIVPGAIATYLYPRMSYALGQGQTHGALRAMAGRAVLTSVGAGLPVAVAGWLLAPPLITRFFPQYMASIPAVRWSLLSGLAWSLAPAAQVLGSLKAWRSLAAYIALLLVARWTFPWLLSASGDPLAGVAQGNLVAAVVTGLVSMVLVWKATVPSGPAEVPA